jgi:hypothetical protein
MSKVLCTFSGKFGDILWSLPTAREIARKYFEPVDFEIMPAYESLTELITNQDYINCCSVNQGWHCEGSPHGDQPWLPQNHESLEHMYEHIYHLTYKSHPGIGGEYLPLVDFIAKQAGFPFVNNPIPFIDINTDNIDDEFMHVAYAFNNDYKSEKDIFLETVIRSVNTKFVDVSKLSWQRAAEVIHTAIAFIGCRSSNWVIANGLGHRNIFIYEPNPARNKEGRFGFVFGNPYLWETSPSVSNTPVMAANQAIRYIHNLERMN